MFTRSLRGLVLTFLISSTATAAEVTTNARLRLARFDVDATPPVGSPLAYDRERRPRCVSDRDLDRRRDGSAMRKLLGTKP